MKLQKILAAYFSDLADKLNASEFDHECLMVLMRAIMHIEECKIEDSGKKSESSKDKEDCKEDDEDCSLVNEVMSALGMPGDFFDSMDDDKASKLGGTKVKIRIIPKKVGINKILKHFKDGGVFTLEAAKQDELGEIFSEELLKEILQMPMFQQGGELNNEVTLENFLSE